MLGSSRTTQKIIRESTEGTKPHENTGEGVHFLAKLQVASLQFY